MELRSDEREDKMIDIEFNCEQFHKYIDKNLSRLKECIWKLLYRKEEAKDHLDFRK